jgi:hypothetical protein
MSPYCIQEDFKGEEEEVKSPTTHRRKRKLLEESLPKILLDSIDAKQGVGVK